MRSERKTRNPNQKYPCFFGFTEDCPVRAHVKLRPESLVHFCVICNIRIKKIKENGKDPTEEIELLKKEIEKLRKLKK